MQITISNDTVIAAVKDAANAVMTRAISDAVKASDSDFNTALTEIFKNHDGAANLATAKADYIAARMLLTEVMGYAENADQAAASFDSRLRIEATSDAN